MGRRERCDAWPCLLPPVGECFPLSSLPSPPPRHPGLPSPRWRNNVSRCQGEPPPVAIGVPRNIRRRVSLRHRSPFVHQWRARVHVHVRTHTRDHASPPRTRGGIARITKRSPPARHRASERSESASSRSPQGRV